MPQVRRIFCCSVPRWGGMKRVTEGQVAEMNHIAGALSPGYMPIR